MKKEIFKDILEKFDFKGVCTCEECHNVGNINDTTIVTYTDKGEEKKYVVQRVNHNIFKDVDSLMNNIIKVTNHISNKVLENGGDIKRESLNLVKTKSGEYYHKTENGNYYRAFEFIDNARTFMKVENEKHIYEAGKALGKFQNYLGDFDAEELFEVIEDFHNTPKRYEAFVEAVKEDKVGRVSSIQEEIQFIEKRKDELSKLVDLWQEGEIPVRVTHNDTKFNNIMIDEDTGEAVCVIDLDTVMPGLSLYDFGDAIRSGCSTAEEDEKDLEKVTIDIKLYENFLKGILEECGHALTEEEKNNIPFSAKLITIELAMRFLTDYINGDEYFKVDYEDHNLVRTRNQLKLAKEMERKLNI
ncbi:MAG: phosphotransferase enzyme family protein [Clostridium sp.]|uniref:phosphotransferase enzyme family protein n=1 Tax=Clostridium sp. TaxID=1506 RepID=UPI003F2FBCEF